MKFRTPKIRPPIKIHGGKYYLARPYIERFSRINRVTGEPYEHFVDCTVGAGSIPLNLKEPDLKITVNDRNRPTVALWKTLRDDFDLLAGILAGMDYCRGTFEFWRNGVLAPPSPPYTFEILAAVRQIVTCRFSRGGIGESFAWSERLRGKRSKTGPKPGDLNAWQTFLSDHLPQIREIVKPWEITSEDCRTWRMYQKENAVYFIDPPYPHETRNGQSTDIYELEWSKGDHCDFLQSIAVNALETNNKFYVCSYPNPMYSTMLENLPNPWIGHEYAIVNHSNQQKTKEVKTEILWESPDYARKNTTVMMDYETV